MTASQTLTCCLGHLRFVVVLEGSVGGDHRGHVIANAFSTPYELTGLNWYRSMRLTSASMKLQIDVLRLLSHHGLLLYM